MKTNIEMLKKHAAAAKEWRSENPEMAGDGYVLFYGAKACGWTHDVINANAYKWMPGVLAVGVHGIDGPIYQATGGNDSAGATAWSIISSPAPAVAVAMAETEPLATNHQPASRLRL